MSSRIIGGLNEKSLHRQLKERYLGSGGSAETTIDGYVIDVAKPDMLIEIQTGGFAGIRTKLSALLQNHPVRLVHPVAAETVISVYAEDGQLRSNRRSPKRGSIQTAAGELLYLSELIPHPNLEIEILLVRQEEVRRDDGRGSWRRRGISIEDRILNEVIDTRLFSQPADYLSMLPNGLPDIFSNGELADHLSTTGTGKKGKLRLAGQITYLLRKLNMLEISGRDGNKLLFSAGSPEHNPEPY